MICVGPTVVRHGSGSPLRHLRDGKLDSVIGAAPAKIPAEAAADLLRTRMRVLIKKGLERDHEPGRAETALRGIVVDERLLDGMERVTAHHRLDRGDWLTL